MRRLGVLVAVLLASATLAGCKRAVSSSAQSFRPLLREADQSKAIVLKPGIWSVEFPRALETPSSVGSEETARLEIGDRTFSTKDDGLPSRVGWFCNWVCGLTPAYSASEASWAASPNDVDTVYRYAYRFTLRGDGLLMTEFKMAVHQPEGAVADVDPKGKRFNYSHLLPMRRDGSGNVTAFKFVGLSCGPETRGGDRACDEVSKPLLQALMAADKAPNWLTATWISAK